MNEKKRAFGMVVDRSGSMATVAGETCTGYDEFIRKQAEETEYETLVTLTMFNTEVSEVYADLPIGEVPPLKLEADGFTALYDAMMLTMERMGVKFREMPEEERPGHVFLVVFTDGQENASRRYRDIKRVREAVEHQRSKYNWKVIFLGADPTTMDMAASMGIDAGTTAVYSTAYSGNTYAVTSDMISRMTHGKGEQGFTFGERSAAVGKAASDAGPALSQRGPVVGEQPDAGDLDVTKWNVAVDPLPLTKERAKGKKPSA